MATTTATPTTATPTTATPTTLTYEEVTEALNKRLERLGPDYIYKAPVEDACVYSTPDSQPSCAVGDVFFQLTPALFTVLHDREWTPLDDISIQLDGDGPYWTYGIGGLLVDYKDQVIVDSALAEALRVLQREQDGGATLKRAIDEFHAAYALYAGHKL